jgi:hypothetical protein
MRLAPSNIQFNTMAPPNEPLLHQMSNILGFLESLEALEHVICYILELSKAIYLFPSLPGTLQPLA